MPFNLMEAKIPQVIRREIRKKTLVISYGLITQYWGQFNGVGVIHRI